MHAVKGGWARQTYALAKSNHESAGRKPRARRSKEEWKGMVEAFIKKHQSSNNGNFPSISLTQKEVGGSFYTIREVVREIIQENRVLGPAKSLPLEQNVDHLSEKFPFDTISTGSETSLSMSANGNSFESDQFLDTGEELYLISGSAKAEPQGSNEQVVDGNAIIVTQKECDESSVAKVEVGEAKELKKNVEEASASRTKVAQIADVVVETFPLQPVTEPNDNLDETSCGDINGTLLQKDRDISGTLLKKDDKGHAYSASKSDGINLSNKCLVDGIEKEKLADPSISLLDEKPLEIVADVPLGSSAFIATKDGVVYDSQVGGDEVKSSNIDKAIAESKVISASIKTQSGPSNGTYASSRIGEPITPMVTSNKANNVVEPSRSSQKKNDPKLDRINLKSWEGDSKKHAETNPLLATFKFFVDAFVKFWSS